MVEIIKEQLDSWGITDAYHNLIRTLFNITLKRDIKRKKSYEGYPTLTLKRLDNISKRIGIKLIDSDAKDYTLYPLLKQFSHLFGGVGSKPFKALEWLNMKMYGGLTKGERLKTQLDFFTSYLEYSEDFKPMTIIDYMVEKEIPHYLRKILYEFKLEIDSSAKSFKDFVSKNNKYFKEVEVYFSHSQDTDDIRCISDAIEELKNLIGIERRSKLLRVNLINGVVDIITVIVGTSKMILPEIMDSFESSITDFSKPIRTVDAISDFLTKKWYLAITLTSIGIAIYRSRLVKIITGYALIKFEASKEYIINEQMIRFFKSYVNLMKSLTPREAFAQSIELVNNDYLRFILERYVNESLETDMRHTAMSVTDVLSEIPYIPVEYLDIMRESDLLGDSEEGLHRVIKLMEPRVEETSKKFNKWLMWAIIIVTTALTALILVYVFKDMTRIINTYDEDFIDRMRE